MMKTGATSVLQGACSGTAVLVSCTILVGRTVLGIVLNVIRQ
jgi:hypothetical protein